MLKNIKKYITYVGRKNLIWLALLSCIFCFCFFTKVNAFVENFVGKEKVTVTAPEDSAVYIMGIGGETITEDLYDSAVDMDGCEYYDAAQAGGSYNMIIVSGGGMRRLSCRVFLQAG